jgi:ribosomal protein L13E
VKSWLERWFARTRARLTPQATLGREAPYVAGYSLLELERAGLTLQQAMAAGLTIDRTRNSALGSNVIQLETFRRTRGWKRPD